MPMMKETMLKRLLLPIAAAGGGGSAPVQDTATGNPLVFFTDLARPLKSLLVPFTPMQEGSGDPSPSNIRSIIPWNGLKVWNGGKNLAKLTYGTKVPSINTGQMVTSNGWSSDFIRIDRAKDYYLSAAGAIGNRYVLYYANDGSYLGWSSHTGDFRLNSDSYFANATYIKIRNDSNSSAVLNIQIEEGSSATPYEAPQITETEIVFPSAVYGGTLDVVSGVLTVEWAGMLGSSLQWDNSSQSARQVYIATLPDARDLTNRKNILCDKYKTVSSNISISSMDDLCIKGNESFGNALYIRDTNYLTLEDFIASLCDTVICYQLATPQEIQLTPAQITALIGNNTIWSDADGQMTATYLKKAE